MRTRTRVTTLQDTLGAATFFPELLVFPEQKVVHRSEILKVLNRAVHDLGFIADIADRGSRALKDYRLTLEEKAALISGDMRWMEENVGSLTDSQRTCLDCMLQREAW